MRVSPRWIRRCSLTSLVLITAAAARLQPNSDAPAESVRPSGRLSAKPKKLTLDPEANVGKKQNKELRKFVRKMDMSADFQPSVGFVVKSSNGNDDCELFIKVATGTFAVERKKDSANPNGFILGLITNPAGCKPLAFTLGVKDTVVWWGRYTNTDVLGSAGTPVDGIGRTGLILLQRDGSKDQDEWLIADRRWIMGYCNHASQGTADQALVLAYAERCSGPVRFEHAAAVMSKAMRDAARKDSGRKSTGFDAYRLLPGANDLALWFACGGDCCYSAFEQ